jgi:hypothetical protein
MRRAGAFPLPVTLVDEWMPRLRDTELRVMLVVVRQTAGWRAAPSSPAHKRRDWLSHSQLVRRTGRGSEAVSAAVASLVTRGLLVVEDAKGSPLTSAAERRRHLGRLYFRLADDDEPRPGPPVETGITLPLVRPDKAGTTTAE